MNILGIKIRDKVNSKVNKSENNTKRRYMNAK